MPTKIESRHFRIGKASDHARQILASCLFPYVSFTFDAEFGNIGKDYLAPDGHGLERSSGYGLLWAQYECEQCRTHQGEKMLAGNRAEEYRQAFLFCKIVSRGSISIAPNGHEYYILEHRIRPKRSRCFSHLAIALRTGNAVGI